MHNTFRHRWGVWRGVGGRVLGSPQFFWGVLAWGGLQMLWVAWSGRYSMAFDEYYHLGIIRLYSDHLSPFISQPPGPAELGAVARDPSFFFHYVLSFPYRWLTRLTPDVTTHLIVLRWIQTALFLGAVVVYRKLLQQLGVGQGAIAVVVLCFLALPVSIQLGAQLNYDTAQFLLLGLSMLAALSVVRLLRAAASTRSALLLRLMQLTAVLLTGCIVKFTFLPFAVGIAGYVMVVGVAAWRRRGRELWGSSALTGLRSWTGAATLLVLGGVMVLALQRYGVNLVRYQNPAPRCDAVLTAAECMAFDPFRRDSLYQQNGYHTLVTPQQKADYPRLWFEQMIWESFIVVGTREQNYPVGNPLPVPYLAGRVIAYGLLGWLVWRALWLWRQGGDGVRLSLVTILVYSAVLIARNYGDFIRVGVPVAVHARYFIPVFLLLGGLAAVAAAHQWRRGRGLRGWRGRAGASGLVLLVLLLVYGSGMAPFLLRSNDSWLWPHAVRPNQIMRAALWPVMVK